MRKIVFFIILFCLSYNFYGQEKQKLYYENGEYFIFYSVQNTQNLITFASKFRIPSYRLAHLNNMDVKDSLWAKQTIKLPILRTNIKKEIIEGQAYYTLYKKVYDKEELADIKSKLQVSTFILNRLNKVDNIEDLINQTIVIGYLLQTEENNKSLAKKDASKNTDTNAKDNLNHNVVQSNKKINLLYRLPDSIAISELVNEEMRIFQMQEKEAHVQQQNGGAVFFKSRNNSKTIYAFHNEAARGSIIKIVNPANNKEIYAKVIGKVPPTEQYRNAVLGISGNGAQDLEVKDMRLFVKVFYIR
ncbi:MAG TPA: hypothetical protein VK027_00045 [Chitinophagaceae bacterium]|nr:hypothetical protein [Chitinophagaceae bacterium]